MPAAVSMSVDSAHSGASSNASSADAFLQAMTSRRSIYSINKNLPISEEQTLELVKRAVRAAPSSFKYETTRCAVFFGAQHEQIWELAKTVMRQVLPAESAAAACGKIEFCFQAGAGTAVFFEDTRAEQEMAGEYPDEARGRADHFSRLATHNCAAAEYIVWTVLAQAGVGATIQHYQNLVGEPVKKAFKLPHWWRCTGLMPFGGIAVGAAEKTYTPLSERMRIDDMDGLLTDKSGSSDEQSNDPYREM